ncbi:SpoIIE family protein phosphatase [candidate division KSB1 bacterium]|nr:SpoIIE family protein phosphatase [candidate division KSB1 bacterium]
MLKNKSIAFKLIFFILLSSALIFSVMFGYDYWMSRNIILKKVRENAATLTSATVNRIQTVLTAAERTPKNTASFLASSHFSDHDLLNLLKNIVETTPEIYGAAIAFEPYLFDKNRLHYAPYYYKQGDSIKFTWLGGTDYQYHLFDWYLIPRVLGKAIWSEPYYDEGAGNIVMTTFSVPFYKELNGKRTFMGVVTADISLDWLQKLISNIRIYDHGYGFLISQTGSWITHPLQDLMMNETIFSTAEWRGDDQLRRIGRDMIQGGSDFILIRSLVYDQPHWIYYMPIPSNGWSVGVSIPQNELMADLNRLLRNLIIIAVLAVCFLFAGITVIAESITRPLRALVKVTKRVATGDLETPIPGADIGDEVGQLADAFVHMTHSLKSYIHNLTETTAAKERIESELKIAHDIQKGILPKIFPPYPEKKELDIYATLQPAKEVGGDFYDFYFVDDRHLCFTIGDVSGKGVPASLLMAVTTTLLKAKAGPNATPDQVLARVNSDLCEEQQSNMFVTAFFGILNIYSGQLTYCNAGHNLPYMLTKENGVVRFQKSKTLVLGVFDHFPYTTFESVLQPRECIFLYTDGVTEAMNIRSELFNEDRLESLLRQYASLPAKDLIEKVAQSVHVFESGAPQADDITIVAIRWNGSET